MNLFGPTLFLGKSSSHHWDLNLWKNGVWQNGKNGNNSVMNSKLILCWILKQNLFDILYWTRIGHTVFLTYNIKIKAYDRINAIAMYKGDQIYDSYYYCPLIQEHLCTVLPRADPSRSSSTPQWWGSYADIFMLRNCSLKRGFLGAGLWLVLCPGISHTKLQERFYWNLLFQFSKKIYTLFF